MFKDESIQIKQFFEFALNSLSLDTSFRKGNSMNKITSSILTVAISFGAATQANELSVDVNTLTKEELVQEFNYSFPELAKSDNFRRQIIKNKSVLFKKYACFRLQS